MKNSKNLSVVKNCDQTNKDLLKDAYNKAIRLLARREYSQYGLQQRLIAYEPDIIQQVIQRLQRENFQSDERFCEMLVNSRFNTGKGAKYIRYELQQQHIDDTLINKYLSSINDEQWQQACYQVWYKKYCNTTNTEKKQDYLTCQKQKTFLQSRGYSHNDWQHFLK